MLSKVFDEQLHIKQDYIYEVKDHLGNVRVTYNEVPKFEDKKYTMTAETEQHYLADRDDYLNFANTNSWRSIDKSYTGNSATSRFSLKISPVDNQPMPQPQKVSMFRLPIRKGEKWSAKVWAFKALNPGIAGQKIPTIANPNLPTAKQNSLVNNFTRNFALFTPIIIPNFLPLFVSSQTTPPARQRCIERLLLLVYCVFLCDKTKKIRFFGQV